MSRLLFLSTFYSVPVVSLVSVADSIVLGCIPKLERTTILAIDFLLMRLLPRVFVRFSHHYARILRISLLNVQSLRLLSLVFADSLISMLNFVRLAHISALSGFERSFCTFLSTTSFHSQ